MVLLVVMRAGTTLRIVDHFGEIEQAVPRSASDFLRISLVDHQLLFQA
jgi:hypothetical protein